MDNLQPSYTNPGATSTLGKTLLFPVRLVTGKTRKVLSLPYFFGNDKITAFETGLESINIDAGTKNWVFDFLSGSEDKEGPNKGKLIVNDNYVLVGRGHEIVVIDRKKGELITVLRNRNIAIDNSVLVGHKFFACLYEKTRGFIQYDLRADAPVWEVELPHSVSKLYYYDDQLLLNGETNIIAYDAVARTERWHFRIDGLGDYEHLGKKVLARIAPYLQFCKNRVLIPVSGYTILALDPNTGTEVWRLKMDIARMSHCMNIGPDQKIHLLGHTSKGLKYYCIDPDQGEILLEKELFKQLRGINDLSRREITESHVLFTDARNGKIYALNRYTWIIDWTFQCGTYTGAENSPVVVNGKLLQKDIEDNLYVFTSE